MLRSQCCAPLMARCELRHWHVILLCVLMVCARGHALDKPPLVVLQSETPTEGVPRPAETRDGSGTVDTLTFEVETATHFDIGEDAPQTRAPLLSVDEQREAVREAMQHAWSGYARYAYGMDELRSRSGSGVNSFGGMGATIVDSLTTLHVMRLDEEFRNASAWVASELDFDKVGEVSVFETVIRILGGLLSAYELSGEEHLVKKAADLGRRLLKAFSMPGGVFPYPRCELNTTQCGFHKPNGEIVLLAEIGSLQLEFRELSWLCPSPDFFALRYYSEATVRALSDLTPADNFGLLPSLFNPYTSTPVTNAITLGAPADSYYEYLAKVWLQGGSREEYYRVRFERLMHGVLSYMAVQAGDMTMLQEQGDRAAERLKMDHFSCFVPGMVVAALHAARSDEQRQLWLNFAAQVTKTCYSMYSLSDSGLAGEHILRYPSGRVFVFGGHELRPEVLESIFYMWRATHDPVYRDWGWNIFRSINKWCRTEDAYVTLVDADREAPQQADHMPSFFLAETLKYMYLLFSDDDVLPLDEWVFNTEGHPLRIRPELAQLVAMTPMNIAKLIDAPRCPHSLAASLLPVARAC